MSFNRCSSSSKCTSFFATHRYAVSVIEHQLYLFTDMLQMSVARSCRLAKLGSMHLVAVNLWTWFRFFLEKQKKGKGKMDSYSNDTTTNATMKSVGIIRNLFSDTEILMSTCVVEYSLIGAGIMLVLWMSIGRPESGRATPFDQHRRQQGAYRLQLLVHRHVRRTHLSLDRHCGHGSVRCQDAHREQSHGLVDRGGAAGVGAVRLHRVHVAYAPGCRTRTVTTAPSSFSTRSCSSSD